MTPLRLPLATHCCGQQSSSTIRRIQQGAAVSALLSYHRIATSTPARPLRGDHCIRAGPSLFRTARQRRAACRPQDFDDLAIDLPITLPPVFPLDRPCKARDGLGAGSRLRTALRMRSLALSNRIRAAGIDDAGFPTTDRLNRAPPAERSAQLVETTPDTGLRGADDLLMRGAGHFERHLMILVPVCCPRRVLVGIRGRAQNQAMCLSRLGERPIYRSPCPFRYPRAAA